MPENYMGSDIPPPKKLKSTFKGTEETPKEKKVITLMDGVQIELGNDTETLNLESGAVGYSDVLVRGLWHMSVQEIDHFRDEKVSLYGKHGVGTYVGAGEIGGTQVDSLKGKTCYEYKLELSGNVLVVPLETHDDTSWELLDRLGLDFENFKGPPSTVINKILQRQEIDGVSYDAVMFYWPDRAHQKGLLEGVVFKPEGSLRIVRVSRVEPK